MGSGAFSGSKAHECFGTGEVFVEFFWLPLEEHVIFRVQDQRRAGDLFSDAVPEMVFERGRYIRAGRRSASDEHTVRESPCGRRRGLDELIQLMIKRRSLTCFSGCLDGRSLTGWDWTQVSDAVVVDAVVGDKSGDPFLECGRAGCEIPAEAYAHQCDLLRIDTRKREPLRHAVLRRNRQSRSA